MCDKNPPKLARKYPPYRNRIPPAPEVNLCSELACSHVLWSVLSLNKSALSLSAINSLCVRFNSLSTITKNLVTWAPLWQFLMKIIYHLYHCSAVCYFSFYLRLLLRCFSLILIVFHQFDYDVPNWGFLCIFPTSSVLHFFTHSWEIFTRMSSYSPPIHSLPFPSMTPITCMLDPLMCSHSYTKALFLFCYLDWVISI